MSDKVYLGRTRDKGYDSTLARIAGNIAAGMVSNPQYADVSYSEMEDRAVTMAIGIVNKLSRREL